jgi:hypothetical protein
MTGSERDVLMKFLRELLQTHPRVYDDMAAKLIAESVSHQPYTTYLLVQRVLMLEAALKPNSSEGEAFTEFLSPHATDWAGRESPEEMDVPDRAPPARRLSLVELGLKAMERNSKIIWTVIFAAFAIVLLIQ